MLTAGHLLRHLAFFRLLTTSTQWGAPAKAGATVAHFRLLRYELSFVE